MLKQPEKVTRFQFGVSAAKVGKFHGVNHSFNELLLLCIALQKTLHLTLLEQAVLKF
jgi:hypothetical protein